MTDRFQRTSSVRLTRTFSVRLIRMFSIRLIYPFTLLEGQGMGTAYEYYSKMRIMDAIFARTGMPRSMVAVGLPEKHGYDLDFVLLAHQLRASSVRRTKDARGTEDARSASNVQQRPLLVCEDRPHVLDGYRTALQRLPDPAMREQVELVQIDSLTDWRALAGKRFDWVVSTASVQRLSDKEIVVYIQNARQIADYALLFIPNSDNRAHLTLSGLRGLDLDRVLALCQQASSASTLRPPNGASPGIIAAGYCDVPPFPPGLTRSEAAKEGALHSPIETFAMRCLEWWCRGEPLIPRFLQKRLAHLVYVALDLSEGIG